MCLSKKLILALQATYLCDKDMDEEEADLYLQLPNILRVHFLNGGPDDIETFNKYTKYGIIVDTETWAVKA